MAAVKNICLEALERNCASGHAGRLDFQRGEYSGQIFVKGGRLVHAQIGALEGIPALFRLFDWGDAETTWVPDVAPEKDTLNLTMEAASQLYAENLQERTELGSKDKSKLDPLLAPEIIVSQQGVESVLKAYTILLECNDTTALPEPFIFNDATKSSYVIGSSSECDVVLNHSTVDPLHCGMILERGLVMIWDLGAQSGVKLNGESIEQGVLKVGDSMTLGNLDLRVRFQLRRPTLKVKTPAPGTPGAAAKPGEAKPADAKSGGLQPVAPGKTNNSGTMPMPKLTPSKEIPKGPITYEKVAKQLRSRGDKGVPFLNKLASLFGKKDK